MVTPGAGRPPSDATVGKWQQFGENFAPNSGEDLTNKRTSLFGENFASNLGEDQKKQKKYRSSP